MNLRSALCLLGLLGCGRFLHREAPDASSSAGVDAASAPTTSASEQTSEDEDEGTVSDGGTCPIAIHPGYCRRNCKSFRSRSESKHAKRVAHASRVGLGKCGALDVFAEDEEPGDAGVKSGIVEFFDRDDGRLVGAIDTRSKPCGEFGEVPKCTPVVTWERSYAFTLRAGTITTSGNQLPVEVIQRIVRQSFGRFKLCHAKSKNPTDEGRVVTKFVIAKDGSVSSTQDAGSDMHDDVIACVARTFSGMSFPQPEGGPLTVTYPLVFSR